MRVNEINYPGADQYDRNALNSVGSQKTERPEPLLKISELAYLLWEKPDLGLTASFMTDFGLEVVQQTSTDLYMRGTGSTPWFFHARAGKTSRFLGAGFVVGDIDQLQKMAEFMFKIKSTQSCQRFNGGARRIRSIQYFRASMRTSSGFTR